MNRDAAQLLALLQNALAGGLSGDQPPLGPVGNVKGADFTLPPIPTAAAGGGPAGPVMFGRDDPTAGLGAFGSGFNFNLPAGPVSFGLGQEFEPGGGGAVTFARKDSYGTGGPTSFGIREGGYRNDQEMFGQRRRGESSRAQAQARERQATREKLEQESEAREHIAGLQAGAVAANAARPRSGNPEEFFRWAAPFAVAAAQQTGIPPAVLMAIAASESGYGRAATFGGVKAQPHEITEENIAAGRVVREETWEPDQASFGALAHEARQGADGRWYGPQYFVVAGDPVAGFSQFGNFLRANSLYRPALEAYAQHRDALRLVRDVNAAGYARDPNWASNVAAIAQRAAPYLEGVPAAPTAAAQAPYQRQGPRTTSYWRARAMGDGIDPRTGNPTGLSQRDPARNAPTTTAAAIGGLQPGISQYEGGPALAGVAGAICGPAAAAWFVRHVGREPTLEEAFNIAKENKLWIGEMQGIGAQAQLINRLAGATVARVGSHDPAEVTRELAAGRPVILNTRGHYYQVDGYNPETGLFHFGDAVGRNRGQGGWARLQDVDSWGYGARAGAIYLAGGQ